MELEWEVKVYHTYCEANTCEEALVAMGCNDSGPNWIISEQPPAQLSH